jgi:hypothetical protein
MGNGKKASPSHGAVRGRADVQGTKESKAFLGTNSSELCSYSSFHIFLDFDKAW